MEICGWEASLLAHSHTCTFDYVTIMPFLKSYNNTNTAKTVTSRNWNQITGKQIREWLSAWLAENRN